MAAHSQAAAGQQRQQQHSLRRQEEEELHLLLYADQVYGGIEVNEVPVFAQIFGSITAYDWPVFDGKDTCSLKPVARAQGQHIHLGVGISGQFFHTGNIVFEKTSSHPGSTIVFTGTSSKTYSDGEWAIAGGTGDFTFAQGVIYYKVSKMNINEEKRGNLIRMDIRVLYRPVTKSQLVHVFSEFNPSEVEDGIVGKEPIGTGAYGDVYKAKIRGTTVAVKILKHKDLKRVKDLRREIEIFKTIRHGNLVTLVGACIERRALIFEFCPKGTLGDRLFSPSSASDSADAAATTKAAGWKPLTWDERVQIVGSICSGLKILHDVPIAHCDLKPNNILFDAQGVCRICDFGLARLLKRTSDTKTPIHHTGMMGTPAYLDPVFRKDGTLTRKSDVYALGIVMLQLVTGRGPDSLKELVSSRLENAGAANIDTRCQQLVDPMIVAGLDDTSKQEALRMIDLALKCSQDTREGRPDAATLCLQIESMKKRRATTTTTPTQTSQT